MNTPGDSHLSNHTVSRRTALKLGALGTAAGASLVLFDAIFPDGHPLADSFATRALGKRLAERFENPVDLWQGKTPPVPKDWATRLKAMINSDFEAGRTDEIDGWWLSETELRLCAFIYREST